MHALEVVGQSCEIFHDDVAATDLHAERHLVPCMAMEEVKVDRYDVRNLLDDLPKRKKIPVKSAAEIEAEAELDRWRFMDLPEGDQEMKTAAEGQAASNNSETREFGYTYANEQSQEPSAPEEQTRSDMWSENRVPFIPPFKIPAALAGKALPEDMKQHLIISKTANFVRDHGGLQTEIVLRVKQASNPNFGFLFPDSELYPYFRFIIDQNPEAPPSVPAPEVAAQAVVAPEAGILSTPARALVSAAYDEESDEADTPTHTSKANSDATPLSAPPVTDVATQSTYLEAAPASASRWLAAQLDPLLSKSALSLSLRGYELTSIMTVHPSQRLVYELFDSFCTDRFPLYT
eukprot:gene5945-7148_t